MSERREKFTPGPWEAHGTSQQDFVTTAWKAKGGTDSPPSPEYICKLGNDNGFYNAALIASAPEMYYLLCNILNDLETDGSISLNDNAANDIRGILAKARGGRNAMPNNDMTFCFGPVKGCPHEKDCARFLENVKLPNGNFYVQDFLMQSIGLPECKFFVPKNNEQNNEQDNDTGRN